MFQRSLLASALYAQVACGNLRDNTSYALYTTKTNRWTTLSGLRISRAFFESTIPEKSRHISKNFKGIQRFLQGNSRFWNPNPLGLGGKTALLEMTRTPKYI